MITRMVRVSFFLFHERVRVMANVGDAAALCEAACAKVNELTNAGEVDNRVINAMVEDRLVRRTELLSGAVKDRKKKVKVLAGIKPARKGYTEAGEEIVGDTYTAAQVEQIKDLKIAIEELDAAIVARDFDKLSKLGY